MDKYHYFEQIKIIQNEAHAKIEELCIHYSKKNRAANVGDIVIDHYHRIRVEKITIAIDLFGKNLPTEIYFGTVLRKDNKPTKRQVDNEIYSQNIKEVIKQ